MESRVLTGFGRFVVIVIAVCGAAAAAGTAVNAASGLKDSGFYVKSVLPTPVYSIPEILSLYYDSASLKPAVKVDSKGHIRELEFIACKGTKFFCRRTYHFGSVKVYEVSTAEYPVAGKLYIDARYVQPCSNTEPERRKVMPEKDTVLDELKRMEGIPYRWGGNIPEGIPEQLVFYPPGNDKQKEGFLKSNKSLWCLEGVDCSGLLYQATGGSTPRNTSDLVVYGVPVTIAGLSVDEIAAKLKPLDLIVWSGHIVIVYNDRQTIESRPRYPDGHKGGVRLLPLKERLSEIMQTRIPVNDYAGKVEQKRFVVRRFAE